MVRVHQINLATFNHESAGEVSSVIHRERYLICEVAPVDHGRRECVSHVFACYASPLAAEKAARRQRDGLRAVVEDAVAAVADPALANVDLGVTCFGDPKKLPAVIRRSMELETDDDSDDGWHGITPLDLSDATLTWLKATPERKVAIPKGEHHLKYFKLQRGGVTLHVVDANQMKWPNALLAALKAGAAGHPMSEEQAERLAPKLAIARVPADYEPDGHEFVAPKRAPGTAPVSLETQISFWKALDSLGLSRADHPVPKKDAEARRAVAELWRQFHEAKAAGTLLATPSQLSYAADIALGLGLDVAFDASSLRSELDAFISEHGPAFKVRKSEIRVADTRERMKQVLRVLVGGPLSAKAIEAALSDADAKNVRNILEGWKASMLHLGLVTRLEKVEGARSRIEYAATEAGLRFLQDLAVS